MGKAQEEISAIKEKTDQTLMEWKGKAEAEYKRLKEELEKKAQPWGDKVKELEEYKKKAEKKIAEVQARAKEYVARAVTGLEERHGLVTFKGGAMTLLGPEVKVGDKAPDFKVADNSLQPATLDSFRGKIKIISSVPSLDTPVCDMETRRFNEEAGKMPDNVCGSYRKHGPSLCAETVVRRGGRGEGEDPVRLPRPLLRPGLRRARQRAAAFDPGGLHRG